MGSMRRAGIGGQQAEPMVNEGSKRPHRLT
jgi:hypothetical protein